MPGNNAYGSKAARNKVLRGVQDDSEMRDFADASPISFRKKAGDVGPLTKMERMAKEDAYKNRVGPGPRLSEAAGDAQRRRLMNRYGVKPSAAPADPGMGLPSMRATIASGERASAMNTADMRGLKMINEGPMSPNDMRAMGDYGKKAKRK
jgi:hypothetical protein